MLWTEAAHVITFAEHLEIWCIKTGKKDERGLGQSPKHSEQAAQQQ